MGLRAALEQNRGVGIGLSLVAVVLLGITIFRQTRPLPPQGRPGAYFTVDDGKNLFVDDITRVVPFEKDGKQAVRAYVFTCDGGKSQFVGYLGKLTDDARKKLEAAEAAERQRPTAKPGDRADFSSSSRQSVEASLPPSAYLFKRPGDAQWIPSDQEAVEQLRAIRCPQGAAFKAVLPDGSVAPPT